VIARAEALTAPVVVRHVPGMGVTAPVLELRGIGKTWGLWKPKPALRDVWLRVEAGECFGLAGPNGAGKTTLIRILLGLTTPDEGEARLFGARPEDPELRRRVGFVPEAATLSAGASPRQLMQRFGRLRGLSRGLIEQGFVAFERLDMVRLLDRPVGRFSKGERQRTLLALALLGEPELLVLDEPTDGLDPVGRALVRQVMREECAQGRTVLLNSHLLAETQRVCTRVGILNEGRLVRDERLFLHAQQLDGTSAVVLSGLPSAEVLAATGAKAAPPELTAQRGVLTRQGFPVVLEHRDFTALNASLDGLRASGALVLEVRPLQTDLEATFAEVVAAPPELPLAGATPVAPPAWSTEPTAPLPPVRLRPGRALRAIGRVTRETASELLSQKLGWMLLALGLIGAGLFWRTVNSPFFVNSTLTAQETFAQLDPVARTALSHQLGQIAGYGLFVLLLGMATLMLSVLAVPLFDPRRTVVLYAQPISRADHVLGLFTGVVGVVSVASLAYSVALWLGLRWLGLEASPRLVLLTVPIVSAFAPVYCATLLGTVLLRSGLFAAICAVAAVAGPAILGASEAVAAGAPTTGWKLLYAFSPKLVQLAQLSGRLGEGGPLAPMPLISTWFVTLALVALLVVVAQRSES
jgi:ABC-2 type transport system ATP-binding protein